MGTKIFELLPKSKIDFKSLSGKVLAIDAYLQLYQFLSTIRQRDGSLLTDSKGNITSHLIGLFSRTTNIMKKNIKPIFVFDGKPPELKINEQIKRKEIKQEAQVKYEIAKESKNIEDMKKFASRTSKLTKEMVQDSKALLAALGIPIVQAPSEGEAQAAHLVKKGHAYALATQDADGFLFGAPRLIKNLTISGRKRFGATSKSIDLEMYELSKILNHLSIDQDQLIALGMLVGTDYNLGGIRGIGPKKALALVKKNRDDFDSLFKEVNWDGFFDFPWTDVFYQIKKIPVTDEYILKWSGLDEPKVKDILCTAHNFSEERVDASLKPLMKDSPPKNQKNLDTWF